MKYKIAGMIFGILKWMGHRGTLSMENRVLNILSTEELDTGETTQPNSVLHIQSSSNVGIDGSGMNIGSECPKTLLHINNSYQAEIRASNHTFRQGMMMKAICFNASIATEKVSAWFRLGYYLWGMDVWINNVPVLKVIIVVNIINIILMWSLR